MRGILLCALLGCSRNESAPRPDPAIRDPLIVHEWGTFATFQGSSGGSLDGMQHETEELPSFVHSLTTAHPSPFAPWGDPTYDVPVAHVGGKMETPVLYFYSQTQRRVRVSVDFTHGLLTQWWPRAVAAPIASNDVGPIDKTTLSWDIDVIPGEKPLGVPDVAKDNPWHFARETKAAWVKSGDEAERYIFYRGLGRIDLPLQVQSFPGVTLVHDCGDEPLTEAIVLDMRATEGRFISLGDFKPHQGKPAMLDQQPLRPRDVVIDELKVAVQSALTAHGLYEDEARAMVRTWSRTWFAAEGTRVIYVVPPKRTEAILPLTIDPKPDTLVRVLVGRHEFLTPERETEIVSLLKAKTPESMRALAALGRFLEPAVRRAMQLDPSVTKRANEILAAFDPKNTMVP
jgi:hypothetical protein